MARMSTGMVEYRIDNGCGCRPLHCASPAVTRISCAPQGGIVRAQILLFGLLQAALLTACDRTLKDSEPKTAQHDITSDSQKSASPVPLGVVGGRSAAQAQERTNREEGETWARF